MILLDQAFAHCPIFLTAGFTRKLGPCEAPTWRIILSNPLKIVGLVSRYLTSIPNLKQAQLLATISFCTYLVFIIKSQTKRQFLVFYSLVCHLTDLTHMYKSISLTFTLGQDQTQFFCLTFKIKH